MATVKRYSVARTQGGVANASVVHSISVDPTPPAVGGTAGSPANSTGSNNGYHRIDEAQMREGKIPTLSYSFGNPGGQAPAGVVNTGAGHDCLTNQNAAGTARPDLAGTTVIATTTTLTNGANQKAAGLVLRVPVNAQGAITMADVRAVQGGEGYTDTTRVQVDGWENSSFTVDVAP